MSNVERLIAIKAEMEVLVNEAITLVPKDTVFSKLSSIYWFSTIKQALGFRNDYTFQYSLDDCITELEKIEKKENATIS